MQQQQQQRLRVQEQQEPSIHIDIERGAHTALFRMGFRNKAKRALRTTTHMKVHTYILYIYISFLLISLKGFRRNNM